MQDVRKCFIENVVMAMYTSDCSNNEDDVGGIDLGVEMFDTVNLR